MVGAGGNVKLRIAGRLATGASSELSPTLLTAASAFRIEVDGINGINGGTTETPYAASLGNLSHVNALILAANGTLDVGSGSNLLGAFAAQSINVQTLVNTAYQSGFPVCAGSCDDGNPCTTDGCGTGGRE